MKVMFKTLSDAALEENDYQGMLEIHIDGKRVFQVYDGEPEDNNLSRNFNAVMNIDTLIELAYHAGANGEPLEIQWEEVDA